MASPQTKEEGFTLVEAVVAFAVLALAAGTLISVFASGPIKALHVSHKSVMLLAAESLLARVGNDQPLVPGEYHGVSDGGVHWTLRIRTLGDEKGDGVSMVTKPYLVTVHTLVGPERNAGGATLTTVRLAVKAP